MAAGGLGAGGVGSVPFGSHLTGDGPVDTFALTLVVAIRENVVRVTFDAPPYWTGVLDPLDASKRHRWTITPFSGEDEDGPCRPVFVARVDRVLDDPLSLDLKLDRVMSGYPCLYKLEVEGVVSTTFAELLTANAVYLGVRAPRGRPIPDLLVASRDIANPQTIDALFDPVPNPTQLKLGQYVIDDTGDVGFDEGTPSYKKRVIRRLTTRKGRFAHLPDYGVTYLDHVKALARPAVLQQLAAEAEEQIRAEPETVACRVVIEQRGSIAYFRIRASTTAGVAEFAVKVPFKE